MNRRSTKFTCFPRHRTPRAGKGEPQRPVFEPLEQRTLLDAAAAPDLVQFAQALTDSGDVTYYGAAWCINCANQSREFEDGAQFLPFVEVTNPDRTGNDIATSEGISAFPTWDFDGTRVEGLLTVEQISTFSGINIPMTEDPFVAPIADKTLLSGTALHIPLDGYHPASKPLFYEVTVVNANGAQVTSTLFEDNRSATIDFTNFGDVTLQLFDQRVPRAANNFAALAELEFYEDKIVHRAVPGFVMQFGSIKADLTQSSSPLGTYDDQFDVHIVHNDENLVSAAKGGDDTNSTDVFITDANTRFLDFNHSVLAMVVEGQSNRKAINLTATQDIQNPLAPSGEMSLPLFDVVISEVVIFDDTENAFFVLDAPEGNTGTAAITVRVFDEHGNEMEQQFTVTVEPDPENGNPFLDDLPAQMHTTVDTPLNIQMTAQDAEDDPVIFSAFVGAGIDISNSSLNAATGETVLAFDQGFVGVTNFEAHVRPDGFPNSEQFRDSQKVDIIVAHEAPAGVDLIEDFDSGFDNDDNLTNETTVQFSVSGAVSGTTVDLFDNGVPTGQVQANGVAVVNVTGLSEGEHVFTATQTENDAESLASPELVVTVDLTDPTDFTSGTPTDGIVDGEISFDVENADEGLTGFSYALQNGPAGAVISPSTGQFTWTPTLSQLGNQSFNIVATDPAGNTASQQVDINVGGSLPTISIADVTGFEGDGGVTDFTFTVSLSTQFANPVTVEFATEDGSAQSGQDTGDDDDYVAGAGTVTVEAFATEATFVVQVNGDEDFELDESFVVRLANPVNGEISDDTASGTIVSDDGPFQNVHTQHPEIVGVPGQTIEFDVLYDMSDGDTAVSGLDLRIHFDSSSLQFVGATSTFAFGSTLGGGQPVVEADVADQDEDTTTDSFIQMQWDRTPGNGGTNDWPGAAGLPLTLTNMQFTFVDPGGNGQSMPGAAALNAGGRTLINFTRGDATPSPELVGFVGQSVAVEHLSLDADRSGKNQALTDGLLFIRYLAGFRGQALISDAVAPDAMRTTAEQIETLLEAAVPVYGDVDDSGSAQALTDGLLTIRFLAGFTGAALVAGATAGPRSDPDDIAAFLDPFLAPPVQQGLARPADARTHNVLADVSPLLLQFDENRSVRQGSVAIDHTQVGAARFAG